MGSEPRVGPARCTHCGGPLVHPQSCDLCDTPLADYRVEGADLAANPTEPPGGGLPPAPPGHLGSAGVFARLDSFRDLAAGWDSYGAQPIDPRAIDKARELLQSLTVVPTSRGGVSIEMGSGDGTVELDISPSGLAWRIG